MDYCHHCQRHLNGALACAGCGTPSEELRLHDPAPHEPDVVLAARDHHDDSGVGSRRPRDGRGRGASRRQRRAGRRAHRRKRRTVLLGVLGLVIAAGALSLAELALENPGGEGEATSVQEDSALEVDGGPPPADSKKPEPPGPVERDTESGPTGSASPVGGGRGDASGEASTPPPSDTESEPAAEPSEPGDPDPEPSGPADPSGPTGPTPGPSTPGEPDRPPPPQPPASPAPSPEPEKPCTPILWMCW